MAISGVASATVDYPLGDFIAERGDTTMATLDQARAFAKGGAARISAESRTAPRAGERTPSAQRVPYQF
ncbi:MAG: hypothetical protein ABIQ16_06955 [Polyangiaceae bacterium]